MADSQSNGSPSGPEKDTFEKSPFNSKKFVFVMVAEAGWKVLLFTMLFTIASDLTILVWGLMMGVIIVSGFVQAGYLFGQAGIDKFVRVAQINAGLGMSTSLKLPGSAMAAPQGEPEEEPETEPEPEADEE